MSLSIQPDNVSKHVAPSAEKQIDEIEKKVKKTIKDIDRLNNSLCCQLCNEKKQEIKANLTLFNQKNHWVVNQTNILAKKHLLSRKQNELLNRLIQKTALSIQLLERKLHSLPQYCFRGFVREVCLKQKHSWVQILPYVAIFGVGSVVSYSFRLGILAGLVNYTFVTASAFIYFKHFHHLHPIPDSKCNKDSSDYYGLFKDVFLLPGQEETVFRLGIQKFVCDVTGSPLAGLAVSSGLFGAVHLLNKNSTRGFQAAQAALISGMIFGILNHYLGLAAPFAAHAMNNFLVCK